MRIVLACKDVVGNKIPLHDMSFAKWLCRSKYIYYLAPKHKIFSLYFRPYWYVENPLFPIVVISWYKDIFLNKTFAPRGTTTWTPFFRQGATPLLHHRRCHSEHDIHDIHFVEDRQASVMISLRLTCVNRSWYQWRIHSDNSSEYRQEIRNKGTVNVPFDPTSSVVLWCIIFSIERGIKSHVPQQFREASAAACTPTTSLVPISRTVNWTRLVREGQSIDLSVGLVRTSSHCSNTHSNWVHNILKN